MKRYVPLLLSLYPVTERATSSVKYSIYQLSIGSSPRITRTFLLFIGAMSVVVCLVYDSKYVNLCQHFNSFCVCVCSSVWQRVNAIF